MGLCYSLIHRLWQEEFKRYLRPLIVNPKRPNAADEYVSDLQHRYEELISGDQEIRDKAYRGRWWLITDWIGLNGLWSGGEVVG